MQDDSALVDSFRNGDAAAFEELYRRHVRSLYSFVYFRTHHWETAEDIVSQTFLQAVQRFDSFDASRGSFGGWIHGIARHLIVDHYRRLRPQQPIEDVWDLPADADTVADADTAIRVRDIRAVLSGLTSKQRETLLLRAWDGRSFAEIAEILGTTEAACKMTYKRTVEALRNVLLVLFLLFSLLSFPSV